MSGARPSTHWADLGESTFVAGMWFLTTVHRLFGRGPFLLFLYPVVMYYRMTRRVAREASMDYLQRLQATHQPFGEAPNWRHGLKHFLSFADTLLDKTLAMNGRYKFSRLNFVGVEHVLALTAQRQGGIFITAHMGCLEMMQVAVQNKNRIRLTVLVHTAHAEKFNRILGRLDPHGAVQLMQVTDIGPGTAMLLSERVQRGEFIAIAGDRVPVGGGRVTRADFLGAPADWPVGAYVLASLLKCPLLTLACLRDGEGHTVHIAPFADSVVLPRGQREEALAALAARFALHLEGLLAQAPYEWFNFFPFWSSDEPAA